MDGLPKARSRDAHAADTGSIDGADAASLAVSQVPPGSRAETFRLAWRNGEGPRPAPSHSTPPGRRECVRRSVSRSRFEQCASWRRAGARRAPEAVPIPCNEPCASRERTSAGSALRTWSTTCATRNNERDACQTPGRRGGRCHSRLSLCQSRPSIRSQSVLDSRPVSAPCAAPMWLRLVPR